MDTNPDIDVQLHIHNHINFNVNVDANIKEFNEKVNGRSRKTNFYWHFRLFQ